MSNRNYSAIATWSDEDECYVATSPEFEGLAGLGETADESIRELYEAIAMACESLTEHGRPLPEARTLVQASGQYRQRLPKSLHASLVRLAEVEGVSMNTLTVSILSQAVAGVEACEYVRRRVEQVLTAPYAWGIYEWKNTRLSTAWFESNLAASNVVVSERPASHHVNRLLCSV